MNRDFSKLCTPAKVYFALAVLASLIALFNRMSIVGVFIKLIFAFIWTFVLGYLCDQGYKSLSWFLVLLPYIIILLVLLGMMNKGMYGMYNMYGNMMGYNMMGTNMMGNKMMGYNGMGYNGMGYNKGYMYEGMGSMGDAKKKMGYANMGKHMM
jgi:hypothetical protein